MQFAARDVKVWGGGVLFLFPLSLIATYGSIQLRRRLGAHLVDASHLLDEPNASLDEPNASLPSWWVVPENLENWTCPTVDPRWLHPAHPVKWDGESSNEGTYGSFPAPPAGGRTVVVLRTTTMITRNCHLALLQTLNHSRFVRPHPPLVVISLDVSHVLRGDFFGYGKKKAWMRAACRQPSLGNPLTPWQADKKRWIASMPNITAAKASRETLQRLAALYARLAEYHDTGLRFWVQWFSDGDLVNVFPGFAFDNNTCFRRTCGIRMTWAMKVEWLVIAWWALPREVRRETAYLWSIEDDVGIEDVRSFFEDSQKSSADALMHGFESLYEQQGKRRLFGFWTRDVRTGSPGFYNAIKERCGNRGTRIEENTLRLGRRLLRFVVEFMEKGWHAPGESWWGTVAMCLPNATNRDNPRGVWHSAYYHSCDWPFLDLNRSDPDQSAALPEHLAAYAPESGRA